MDGDVKMETSDNASNCDSLINGGNPEDLIESAKKIANAMGWGYYEILRCDKSTSTRFIQALHSCWFGTQKGSK